MEQIFVEEYVYNSLLPNINTDYIRRQVKNNKTLTSIYIESYLLDNFINNFEYEIEELYGELHKFLVDIYEGHFSVLIHFKDLNLYDLDRNKFENNIYNLLGYNEAINFNYFTGNNSVNITFYSYKINKLYSKIKEKLLQKLESLLPCTDDDKLWTTVVHYIKNKL